MTHVTQIKCTYDQGKIMWTWTKPGVHIKTQAGRGFTAKVDSGH
jgi:hypothetical protein